MEIIDYPNYLIYRDGRVWNKKRNMFKKEGIRKDGYKVIYLCKDGKRKFFSIHRLVGIHYLPNPENKKTIDHINRDPSDNRVENLQWATHKEQCENRGIRSDNSSGYIGINYCKTHKVWKYRYRGKYKIHRSFKCKIDALCYKYIHLLKIKSNVI